eukprot:13282226-Ditylum_brightwellii.AAC.1
MVTFANAGYKGKELDLLNHCHLFLQATMLADMTLGSGRYMVADTFKGIKIQTHSGIEWSCKSQPSQAYWMTWEVAVKLTFKLKRNNSFP